MQSVMAVTVYFVSGQLLLIVFVQLYEWGFLHVHVYLDLLATRGAATNTSHHSTVSTVNPDLACLTL